MLISTFRINESDLLLSSGIYERFPAGQAVQLLADVGIFNGNIDKLQWSVLYNLTTGYGEILANRNTNNIIGFNLDMDK